MAIDVGGTKTLLAVFDESGQKIFEHRISTPEVYSDFLTSLQESLGGELGKYIFRACCCAIPAVELDRERGIGISFGNLAWKNVHIKEDLAKIFGIPIYVENDAKLAGLYEAITLNDINKILYITIGTGIGIAIITNGVIDTAIGDAGGRGILLDYEGKQTAWDDISSGRALAAKYSKRAGEIEDPGVWQEYVKPLAKGLEALIGLSEPDAIVIGGGVGAHLDKFGALLEEELHKHQAPKIEIPKILEAKRPEEAVIYGCYAYIKQQA